MTNIETDFVQKLHGSFPNPSYTRSETDNIFGNMLVNIVDDLTRNTFSFNGIPAGEIVAKPDSIMYRVPGLDLYANPSLFHFFCYTFRRPGKPGGSVTFTVNPLYISFTNSNCKLIFTPCFTLSAEDTAITPDTLTIAHDRDDTLFIFSVSNE